MDLICFYVVQGNYKHTLEHLEMFLTSKQACNEVKPILFEFEDMMDHVVINISRLH